MQLNFDMTTVPTIVLWIVGLVIFGIGSMLGYFSMNVDARKKQEALETKAEIVRTDAERKLAEAAKRLEEAQALKSNLPEAVADPALLRIKRDKTIELDGAPLAGTLSAERKRRLLELISLLRPFLDAPAQPDQTARQTISPPTVPPVSVGTTRTPAVPAPSLLSALIPGQSVKKKDDATEFKLLSIVQQIDTVLQKRLEGGPLEKLGIRLHDSPQGGVEVYIGLQKFDTIDEVPDPNIKTVIRAAVAEWEEKYTPGL